MNEQEVQIDIEYRDAILKRLVEHFRNGDHIPYGKDAYVLTFELLHHLCRDVVVEGYGQ